MIHILFFPEIFGHEIFFKNKNKNFCFFKIKIKSCVFLLHLECNNNALGVGEFQK